jgi:threonine/homoserine/homoserine lactone efflux protein
MEHINVIIAVISMHVLAVASPGPDFFLEIKNTLQYSRKIGIYTGIGFALGNIFHISYSIFGVQFLKDNNSVMNIIQLLGAFYIIFIGLQALGINISKLKVKKQKEEKNEKENISIFEAIKMGVITNLLNAKSALYFVSIFTVIVPISTPRGIVLSLGVIMIIITFIWFSIVAYFFTKPKIRSIYLKQEKLINKVLGSILIFFGLKLIWGLILIYL